MEEEDKEQDKHSSIVIIHSEGINPIDALLFMMEHGLKVDSIYMTRKQTERHNEIKTKKVSNGLE